MFGGYFDRYHEEWDEAALGWFEALLDEDDVDVMAWALGTQDARKNSPVRKWKHAQAGLRENSALILAPDPLASPERAPSHPENRPIALLASARRCR